MRKKERGQLLFHTHINHITLNSITTHRIVFFAENRSSVTKEKPSSSSFFRRSQRKRERVKIIDLFDREETDSERDGMSERKSTSSYHSRPKERKKCTICSIIEKKVARFVVLTSLIATSPNVLVFFSLQNTPVASERPSFTPLL